ncbi:MAG: RDD family protein [Candidatus Sedimenticola endophacoides]|uniref:RDD family protein n=2 Tax=Candidatus Sedimenticola endophacoides TaxID=2548426 RepID=A0A657PUG6_9GAMM|nr:MAG: RDD family protein [Candidatus Sedimenticola endophacoides]OQX35530.1 MAG: RDD family protein [Candidatus Sedimenticola endophacoides]OQX40689.1 MAG: RDD family protein [Candidatus Sedimenticola endophacoides]OQX42489.1 MAG: RDD family protein [Candidatus Sedimenticola endophacoides]OQX44987.1 MAG: RDD family protein [Candidatus Sedimenticola endophacoides]
MSTPPALADTIRTYETPEGVRLRLRLAGPVVRACAWAIDLVIRLLLYALVVGIFAFFGGVGTALMLISFFLLEWFYPVVFEISGGATPGKRAMGLVVIHDNGTPIALPSSLIRNLLRGADFLPLLYAAGLLSMLVSRDFQRLGDLAAGTLVVYREREPERAELPRAVSVRPPVALSVGEQRELIEFAERSARLSPGRQVELAELLRGITGKQGDAAVCELHSYAQWLTRGR